LISIKLDDVHPFHLKSDNFNFNLLNGAGTSNNTDADGPDEDQTIRIYLNNGTIEPSTFRSLPNSTNIVLHVGERKECDTMACLYDCNPTALSLTEIVFRPFLKANPNNRITTSCYLECSCEQKWIYENWNDLKSQFSVWDKNKFFCAHPGVNPKSKDSFWGVDYSKLDFEGEYFTKSCN
jgi:hypothetical protein